jgi:hypothetical protein
MVYEKVNMNFVAREMDDRRGESGAPRAKVYRLANGRIVYIEKDINAQGWARITMVGASGNPCCARWTYASAADAESALADWDPEAAPAPAGWFLCGQRKSPERI